MKNTKRATRKQTAPATETVYTVIYPDGQVVVMHNSSRTFRNVLNRNKANGSIRLWLEGDQTAALSYLTFGKEGAKAPPAHPFLPVSSL